ncbi:hypothetical protein [Paenibacillus sp. PL91]|uniref:hypothetical protein n=1 Tax=Paenibacillus sp. PL91 TaxID=2729538 RepID=UPI001659AC8F|nr:hypothetical protein [Paenibacillus sp. PL91]MBC9202040.1 hypothetical protein [Paenibacillus sp. PL91]
MIYKAITLGGNTSVSNLSRATNEDIMEGNYDRPIGVSILAILMAISGVGLLIIQLLAFSVLNEASPLVGVTNTFIQAAIGFLGLLGLAGGVGMWLGKKWGWWLAMFYFAYAITRNANAWLSINHISDQYGALEQNLTSYYIKYGIRILWNVLLLYFMCRENVMSFFNTTETKKWKALLIVFVICLAIFAAGMFLN